MLRNCASVSSVVLSLVLASLYFFQLEKRYATSHKQAPLHLEFGNIGQGYTLSVPLGTAAFKKKNLKFDFKFPRGAVLLDRKSGSSRVFAKN